jgi:hypothetical protein
VWKMVPLCIMWWYLEESETIDVSMTPRDPPRNLSTFFFLPFSPGQRAGWPRG